MKLFRYIVIVLAISVFFFACQKNPPAKEEVSEPSTATVSKSESVEPEALAASGSESDPIVVSSLTGTAQFQHTVSGAKQPLAVGQVLVESDIITSGDDAVIVITLEEGKEIHLGGDTVFALSAIRRDSNGNVNILALKQGSIVNVVDTKLADNDVYEVHTPRLVMSVRGTSNYMETGADGDTVIGITGETHVFSDGASFNVPQGSAVSQPEGAPPMIAPSDSESLPPLASSFASSRNITYPAISEDDLARSQQNAESFKPSQDFEGTSSFSDALFNNPDITVPNSAPTPTAADEPQPAFLQPTPMAITPTIVTPTDVTPTEVEPQSDEPSQSSSSVEKSESNQASALRQTSILSQSSSSRSSRSSSSSSKNSSSSNTPAPQPVPQPEPESVPQPQPSYDHIHIKYTDFSTGSEVLDAKIGTINDGYYRVAINEIKSINDLTKAMLPVPDDHYLISFTPPSARLSDGHILVDAKVIHKNTPIVIRLYEGTTYGGATCAATSAGAPITAEVLFEGDIDGAVADALKQFTGIKRMVPGTVIDSSMLYANDVMPSSIVSGSVTGEHSGKLALWIPIEPIPTQPTGSSMLLPDDFLDAMVVDSAEPPSEDSAEPPSEDSTEPPSEDSTEPPSEDSTEPTSEDSSEPTSDDSTEPTSEDSTEPPSEDSSEPALD